MLVGSIHSLDSLRIKEFLTRNGHSRVRVGASGGLAESMSRYLIRRIKENPKIQLPTHTEITTLDGRDHLEGVQ